MGNGRDILISDFYEIFYRNFRPYFLYKGLIVPLWLYSLWEPPHLEGEGQGKTDVLDQE